LDRLSVNNSQQSQILVEQLYPVYFSLTFDINTQSTTLNYIGWWITRWNVHVKHRYFRFFPDKIHQSFGNWQDPWYTDHFSITWTRCIHTIGFYMFATNAEYRI